MATKSLQEFNNDVDTKNNVHEYLIEFLRQEAVEKVFKKQDTSAIAEAKEMIDKAFENLGIMFHTKVEPKPIKEESR